MDFTTIDRRYIFLLVAVALIIFLYIPFKLPTEVDPEVQDYFDAIEALTPGDTVIVSSDYSPSTDPEVGGMHENTLYHLFRKDCRVIGVCYWPEGPDMTRKHLPETLELLRKDWGIEKQAGTDYVELPYLSGNEIAIINTASSIPDAMPKTRHGEDTASLPIMQGINGIEKPDPVTGERTIDLVITISAGDPGAREWIRHVGKRHDARIMAGSTSVMATDLFAFRQSGQIVGFLGGLPGSQQYEMLLLEAGIRKEASDIDADMAIQSVVHFLIIGLIVLGNIGHWRNKRRGIS